MKKILVGIAGIAILIGLGRALTYKSQISNLTYQINTKNQITNIKSGSNNSLIIPTLSRSLFIPYWSSSITEKDLGYDTYYYFGIRPTIDGSVENEIGLQNMPIVDAITEKKKKLVIRMLDASVNEALLTYNSAQKIFFMEINAILEQNAFSGIVLDIEIPFTLQAEKKGQITNFVQQMCSAIKSNYKTCDLLIYGDVLYRNRPYDLQKLSKATDTILFMAYDFHKAGGEPGPNFNFDQKQKYGYDFKTMISDVTLLVPQDKIEVVFGMYGYDWTLNEQGTPLKSASALSLNSIKQKAESLKLKITSNNAKEKYIEYVDSEGNNHIIWYEDEESVEVKTKYLLERGVSKVSFWAQSYF